VPSATKSQDRLNSGIINASADETGETVVAAAFEGESAPIGGGDRRDE